jgi:hypothetical protein
MASNTTALVKVMAAIRILTDSDFVIQLIGREKAICFAVCAEGQGQRQANSRLNVTYMASSDEERLRFGITATRP